MAQATTAETVHDALVQVFAELDAWCERPLAELEACPAYPGAWSAAEHLEHVSLANHFLLLTIRKGCAKALGRAGRLPLPESETRIESDNNVESNTETGSDLAPLAPIAEPDAFDWSPPAHMVPVGGRSPGELRDLLRAQGSQCLELLSRLPGGEGRLYTIRMSVHDLGRLDLYQWLYFLAQHGRYHLTLLGRRSA
jgi:hypothetical protein